MQQKTTGFYLPHGEQSVHVAFTLNAHAAFLLRNSKDASQALNMLQKAEEIYTHIFPDESLHSDLRQIRANIEKANQLIAADTSSASRNPNALFAYQPVDSGKVALTKGMSL